LRTFHFDLRHLKAIDELQVSVHGSTFPLVSHSESTLTALRGHATLAHLPAEAASRFSHFVNVEEGLFPAHNVGWVRVERPARSGVHLAQVVMIAQHIPEDYLRAYFEQARERYNQPLHQLQAFYRPKLKRVPRRLHAKLAALGLQSLPQDAEAALDALVQAQTLVTSLDTAGAFVSYHPDLANTQPYTAAVVYNEHILPDPELDPVQYNLMQILEQVIKDTPDWSPVIECTDQYGNPLKAGYTLDGIDEGQQLYTFGVAEPVLQSATLPTAGARRTASDDIRLQNKIWVPTPGTSVLQSDGESNVSRAKARNASAAEAYKWTIDERTDHHGVSVDQGSIRVDAKDHFSIDANNGYLRTLYTGYQLYDEAQKPIGNKEKLWSISSVNTLIGIPVPTDPTKLDFDLKNAASIKLFFGSLGVTDWDSDFSTPGALLTGLWQYGIPIVFLIAGKAVTSTSVFNKIVNDKDLTAAAIGVAFPIVGGGVATASALFNTKKVLFSFGNAVLGIVITKGLEKLGTWLVTEAGKGAISSAFGPIGWVFRLAAVAMNVELMAITTGQVLSSPANITINVSRAINVKLSLHPDPAHGEVGHPETAVWPAIATKYVATLQYRGGTSHQLLGPMSPTTEKKPIELLFETVPAGGDFRILAGVYSESGWLAGAWESDWIAAKPNQGSTLDLGKKDIKENLVPLAPDTQYVYKEKIANKDGKFVWETGLPPATTRSQLSCDAGGTLCELVGISINNSAFQVGYAWRSSGQNLRPDSASAPPSNEQLYAVQNLSVLAEPNSRLKTTGIGFTSRPAIAYAPSTNRPNQIDQTNFVLDPRGGGMNLRQVVLDGSSDFGFGDVGVPSWGKFPLENVDALAVHPSNAVIAASWREAKLMILQLPEKPTEDGKAREALMVSGEGVRQGLVNGPKVLAVAPDGRILVLESIGKRIQAFDTKGNPVPSFTPSGSSFELPTAAIAAELDQGKVPEAFQAALVASGATFQFTLPVSFITQLDAGIFQPAGDPLILALSRKGVILSYDPDHMNDPALSAQIKIVKAKSEWIITDPRRAAWTIVSKGESLSVLQRPDQVAISVEKPGANWLLVDRYTGRAWKLSPSTADPTKTLVSFAYSFFPLRGLRVGELTYLDMAVEAQGYIYVLMFQGDGSKTTDYLLDVYSPDGKWLFRSPDPSKTLKPENVVAGKMTVDVWRNLYALTYESIHGVKGGPEPGIAHWLPTPPLFSLDLKLQTDFNDKNIGVISVAFGDHKVPLSSKAFIVVNDREGAWEVKDGITIYYVYRSGDGLQVYSIPA
jgi:hypothetical protein